MDLAALKAAANQFIADSFGGSLNPELGQAAKDYAANFGKNISKNTEAFKKAVAWKQGGLDAMTGSSDTRRSIADDEAAAALNMVGPSALGRIVYHGSPYKFDRFDMSKIGSGEGSQAYGHGLYFADSPDVAISYRDNLSNGIKSNVMRWINEGKPEKEILKHIKTLEDTDLQTAKKVLQDIKNNPPSIYKVDIPDEAVLKMIDWDKPLREQKEVLETLKNSGLLDKKIQQINENRIRLNEQNPQRLSHPVISKLATKETKLDDLSGNSAVSYLAETLGGHENAVEKLKGIGIPGIRYLDAGSRDMGAGTSNYVLFSDQLPRILERNGESTGLQPWFPGEWKGIP